jgi:predicted adenylyl cyclase CyaB
MNMQQNIEVEIRGLLNDLEYDQIIKFLDQNGTNKEIDDRKTTFFIMPDKTLKISEKVSKGKAKISLKMGDIVKDASQTEYEIDIKPSEFNLAEQIFLNLGFDQIQHTEQKRINYSYAGVEFAIKWSVDWGYHFEMEKMLSNEDSVDEARNELNELAKQLNLTVMSEEEFGRRCAEIDAKYTPKN